jgi:uroporphyrinogen-III synthase
MRVLVIRPEPAASHTADALRKAGHEPIVFAMSTCVCQTKLDWSKFEKAAGYIFTSANALRCLNKTKLNEQDLSNKPTFCVGEQTAKLAKQLGFDNIVQGTGGGKALVEPILKSINDQAVKSGALLYLTVKDRTPDLENLLAQSKVLITPMITYKMISDYSEDEFNQILRNENIEVVLFYAKSAVRRFFSNEDKSASNLFTTMRYGCLSKEIAREIPDQYSKQVDIAAKPTQHHLIANIGN